MAIISIQTSVFHEKKTTTSTHIQHVLFSLSIIELKMIYIKHNKGAKGKQAVSNRMTAFRKKGGKNHNVTSHTWCPTGTLNAGAEELKIIFQVPLTSCHLYRF